MPDANSDVPGTVAVPDKIVALIVHTTLLDGIDLRVAEVSKCNVLYRIISSSMLLEAFFTQNFFSCPCLIKQLCFPKISAAADLNCHYC
jgi:hypothetical protein